MGVWPLKGKLMALMNGSVFSMLSAALIYGENEAMHREHGSDPSA